MTSQVAIHRLSIHKKLLFSGVVAFAALVTGEIGLRLCWHRPPRFIASNRSLIQPDRELGWHPRPQLNVQHRFCAGGPEVDVRTNSHGFRDVEHDAQQPAADMRIVVVGDSYTFGYGVGNQDMFTHRLQELLPNTEVVNLGVSAYDLRQEHRLLRREGLRYRPQIVVLALCLNDICLPRERYEIGTTPAVDEPDGAHWLNEHCFLCDFVGTCVSSNKPLSKLFVSIGLKRPLGGFQELSDVMRPALAKYPPEMNRSWEATASELTALSATCRSVGAHLVIAPIPAPEVIDRRRLNATLNAVNYQPDDFDVSKPYRKLAAFCKEQDIVCCDSVSSFRAAGIPLFLAGDMHFNADGHRLFATQLMSCLKEILASVDDRPSPAAASRPISTSPVAGAPAN